MSFIRQILRRGASLSSSSSSPSPSTISRPIRSAAAQQPSFLAATRASGARSISQATSRTFTAAGVRAGAKRTTAGVQIEARVRTMASAAETDQQAAAVANATGINETSLQNTLKEKLGAEYVLVQDISGGCGQSFEAIIVSSEFEKKMTLARHRLVNSALKQEIAAIHAWTPKCFTPAEWEKKGKA